MTKAKTQKSEKTPKTATWDLIKNPKQREVIYGLTDRRKDYWLIQLNDWLLDHQSFNLKDKSRFFRVKITGQLRRSVYSCA